MQTSVHSAPVTPGYRSGWGAAESFVRPRGRLALERPMPDGPPMRRLTSRELRQLSQQWHGLARRGDERAARVAQALEWVAVQRARDEPARAKLLAERVSQWMGL